MSEPIKADEVLLQSGSMNLGDLGEALVAMVDDEALVIELTQAFLEQAGFSRFTSTSDSTSAIAMLRRERPKVLLLDINMPKVTGFDVLAEMQKDPVLKHIPTIVLTTAEDPETKLRALDLGATDFLRKPVDPSELALRMRNTLAAAAHRESIQKAFSRYVSPRLVERIISETVPFGAKAQRAEVVVMFADLRGFTHMTEVIDVEPLVEMLNEYFAALTAAAHHYDGTIFNMSGDCLLVGFNVPFPQPNAAARAWATAKEMQSRFGSVAARWREHYDITGGLGIGMCRGEAVIGNVGSPNFMSYTVIGNTVNIASRLMQAAVAGEALVSGELFESIRKLVPASRVVPRGNMELRGLMETISVFSIRL
ncbi:MAG: response regulator [Burkholderiales bacterium]|nr:response regulator [Burkholderiales bacterium]